MISLSENKIPLFNKNKDSNDLHGRAEKEYLLVQPTPAPLPETEGGFDETYFLIYNNPPIF